MPLWQHLRSPFAALGWGRFWLQIRHGLRAGPLMSGVFVVAIVLGAILYAVAAIDHDRVRSGTEESAKTLSLALKTQLETSLAETDRLLSVLATSLPVESDKGAEAAVLSTAPLPITLLPPALSGAAVLTPDGKALAHIGAFGITEQAQAQAYILSQPPSETPRTKGVTVLADALPPPPPSLSLGKMLISTPIRISAQTSRQGDIGENMVLFIARPILNHAQDTIGWAVALFDPNAFGAIYRSLGMGAEHIMTLLRPDGAIIGRAPYRLETARMSASQGLLISTLIPKATQGTYWGNEDSLLNSPASKTNTEQGQPPSMMWGSRESPTVYAYAALPDYPLIAIVGVSAKDALAGWTTRAVTLAFVGCGGLIALLFLSQRITGYLVSLHQSEQRYRAAETHLSHAQSLAHIGSWEWTLRNNQMWWSTELIRIYGLSHRFPNTSPPGERASLQPSYDLFLTLVHPEDRAKVAIVIGKALQDGQAFAIDYRISLKDSGIRHMHHEGQCVLEEDGSVGRMDCVIQDVTESATLHAQLAQAAKLSTLGEMAAGMAHELSQPLNIMKMSVEGALFELDARTYSQKARRSLSLPLQRAVSNSRGTPAPAYEIQDLEQEEHEENQLLPSIRNVLERIAAQTNRMGQILDHIRIFSQKDAAPANIFDGIAAVTVAGDVMKSQCEHMGIQLHVDTPQQIAPVKGRAVQLEQVLVNLLANAKESILEHQKQQQQTANATFGTPLSPLAHGHIRLSARIVGNSVFIQVSDNGAGIPPDLFNRLFEPFFTTKGVGQGTGLGLSVAYGIITAMGGDLSARNEPLGGACFEIRLPLQAGGYDDTLASLKERVAPAQPLSEDAPPRSLALAEVAHILIIESSPQSSALLRALLTAQGFDVSISHDSKETERILKARPVRLLVLDHESLPLSEAKNIALQLCQDLRRVDPLVPMLHLVTGSPESSGEPEGTVIEDRAFYCLEIPQDRSHIVKAFRSLLGIPDKETPA